MTNPTSNFGWQMPTSTDLVTDLPADFETFGQAVDTSLADLKGGTTGQVLSKASGTDMDFTWVTSDDANAIQNAIVDAKGDLIAASAADTPARLAVGNNGETLVADSSATTGLRYVKTSPNYANNGAFDFWQRGTSFTVTNTNSYTADRFYCYAGGANATAARSTSVPTSSIAPYSLEFTGAASQTLLEIGQRIESQYINALKTTVTFSAKVYNNTGAAFTPTIYIQTPTAVDNWTGLTNIVNNVSLQSCADGAWTTIYYTADWSGYSNISNGAAVVIEFATAAAGVGKKIRITEWQVTPTPIIMPFQRSSGTLAGELAACQRYYFRTSNDSSFARFAFGSCESTTAGVVQFMLPVQMRVAPTAVEWSNLRTTDLANDYGAPSSVTINTYLNTRNIAVFNVADTGWTAYRPLYLEANNNAAAHLAVTAEL